MGWECSEPDRLAVVTGCGLMAAGGELPAASNR